MSKIEDGIIVTDPEENHNTYRRFTSSALLDGVVVSRVRNSLLEGKLAKVIAEGIISPERFPLAVDLFAGDGSWAKRLVDNGWAPANITCVDIARTETPLVDGVNWLYLDLAALAHVANRGHLHGQVGQLRGRFDLAFSSFGAISTYGAEDTADILCGFFIRRGGIAYAEGDFKLKGSRGKLIPLVQV